MLKEIKQPIILILIFLLALLIPKIKGKKKPVDWTKIQDLLKEAFGEKCTLFLVDGEYRIPTLVNFQKFLKEDKTDLYRYVPEEMDCDDFSFRLMGQVSYPGWSDIAFGIATSQTHAYNCIIAEDSGQNRVFLVEPQNDRIFLAPENPKVAYKTTFVMM